jgi:hypothetical protein
MSKKLQLHVAEPCHENWDNMSPSEKGRFCDACQKQVVDFSGMSDREIAQFFKKPSTGSVCGRFMNDQLDRNIVPEKKRLPWIKYFFQFVFPAFVISKQAYTQGMLVRRPPVSESSNRLSKNEWPPVDLKMVITDAATGLPVPYASVNIVSVKPNSPKLTSSTKADGSVVFQLKDDYLRNVEISSVGYKSKTITLYPFDLWQDTVVKTELEVDAKELEEVKVVAYGNTTKRAVIMGALVTNNVTTVLTYHNEEPVLPVQSKTVASKVFPNPLPQTQTATIEINAKENGSIYAAIVDANGKVMGNLRLNVAEGINRFAIDATSKLVPGIYFIRLTDDKGKLVRTDQLIIQ